MKQALYLLIAFGLYTSQAAQAHDDHGSHATATAAPKAPEQQAWGIAGTARNAKRTITLTMMDNMRFTPDRIEVKAGETVRLRVRNAGQLMHELVIGTRKELEAHAAMMRQHPGMSHDAPYMTHVRPSQTGEIVWTFNRAGEFEFACLVAGHFEAGMTGRITVR